ncbi:hypothetical protein [Streptomyces sp. NPDC002088]|uniref:hypothetical protein n=1 Tax=Streptomyces sp. NPDC002088 TaxID=3154665 RepID=UPI0033204DFB
MMHDEQVRAYLTSQVALGRGDEPDDIGAALAALLSDANRWVTAQRVEISGGAQGRRAEPVRQGEPPDITGSAHDRPDRLEQVLSTGSTAQPPGSSSAWWSSMPCAPQKSPDSIRPTPTWPVGLSRCPFCRPVIGLLAVWASVRFQTACWRGAAGTEAI